MNFFGHSENLHSDNTSTAEHLITEPFFAIPLFFLFMIGLYYALISLGVKVGNIIVTELAILFIVGVATYSLIPALSILALSIGIISALFITLSILAN